MRSPPKDLQVGDMVDLLVAPYISGMISEIRDGKYESELVLKETFWGTVTVGAKNVRRSHSREAVVLDSRKKLALV